MISNLKNPWVRAADLEKLKEQQESLRQGMAKKAKEILADEKFKVYKEMFDQYHTNEMENILMLDEQEPLKYAFKMRQIVDTLKAYRLLISSIEDDAQQFKGEENIS